MLPEVRQQRGVEHRVGLVLARGAQDAVFNLSGRDLSTFEFGAPALHILFHVADDGAHGITVPSLQRAAFDGTVAVLRAVLTTDGAALAETGSTVIADTAGLLA